MKRIYEKLHIPPQKRTSLTEIRLRVNKPVVLVSGVRTEILSGIITKNNLADLFALMCGYSVYSKQNEIKNGYITLKGGHRAGICGTAVYGDEGVINIRDISAVNIRIAREYIGCSNELLRKVKPGKGMLICGAPCSGKTTLLRDTARSLSNKYKIALIDTRGEIASVYQGENQLDVGDSFVLDGYNKSDGFDHSVRCLSPDYIICDEIGTAEDSASVLNAVNSGVGVIASAHCADKQEVLAKPFLRETLRFFDTIVFLGNRHNTGQITEAISYDELFV
ncbi:MAG: ATPase, T2SS/T4P/T4SS family [Ruminococcus sp.]|nr:ATPase, T2SS/T4P/T4SS family [Ruminococcus sp.]